MHAFHAEPSAIKRDKIAGDAARLLKAHLPPRDRKLSLPYIYEMFDAKRDQAYRGHHGSLKTVLTR